MKPQHALHPAYASSCHRQTAFLVTNSCLGHRQLFRSQTAALVTDSCLGHRQLPRSQTALCHKQLPWSLLCGHSLHTCSANKVSLYLPASVAGGVMTQQVDGASGASYSRADALKANHALRMSCCWCMCLAVGQYDLRHVSRHSTLLQASCDSTGHYNYKNGNNNTCQPFHTAPGFLWQHWPYVTLLDTCNTTGHM